MASISEGNLLRWSGGFIPVLPGMNGPVNTRRMDEISMMLTTLRNALVVEVAPVDSKGNEKSKSESALSFSALARRETLAELVRAVSLFLSDPRLRYDSEPLMEELVSVIQMVAVEVLEIRGSRAMRAILRV